MRTKCRFAIFSIYNYRHKYEYKRSVGFVPRLLRACSTLHFGLLCRRPSFRCGFAIECPTDGRFSRPAEKDMSQPQNLFRYRFSSASREGLLTSMGGQTCIDIGSAPGTEW